MLAKKVVLSLCLCPVGSLSFFLTAFSLSHTAVSNSVRSAEQIRIWLSHVFILAYSDQCLYHSAVKTKTHKEELHMSVGTTRLDSRLSCKTWLNLSVFGF